jgi:hypothetical protein
LIHLRFTKSSFREGIGGIRNHFIISREKGDSKGELILNLSVYLYLSHTFLVTHLSLLSQIIPKILHELMLMKEGIDAKQKEINIYDKAIAEIEASYEHILYSEEFYVDDQNY